MPNKKELYFAYICVLSGLIAMGGLFFIGKIEKRQETLKYFKLLDDGSMRSPTNNGRAIIVSTKGVK